MGIEKGKRSGKAIKENSDKPTFENTILALENSSEMLEEATNIFYNLMNCESDDEFKKMAQQIGPMLSQFHNELYTDEILFEKVKTVYQNHKDLNQEEARLLETNYKSLRATEPC